MNKQGFFKKTPVLLACWHEKGHLVDHNDASCQQHASKRSLVAWAYDKHVFLLGEIHLHASMPLMPDVFKDLVVYFGKTPPNTEFLGVFSGMRFWDKMANQVGQVCPKKQETAWRVALVGFSRGVRPHLTQTIIAARRQS